MADTYANIYDTADQQMTEIRTITRMEKIRRKS